MPQIVKAYNDTVHSTIGVALSRVIDSDVLAISKRVEARTRRRVRVAKKNDFSGGQDVASGRRSCGLPRLPNRISAPRFSGRESN